MTIEDAINITIAACVPVTIMFYLPFYLLVLRRKPDAGNGSRSSRFGTDHRMTTRAMHGYGVFMAVVAITMLLLGVIVGYMWFWGIVAYSCVWLGIMMSGTSQQPRRFHKSLRLYVLGCFVFATALGLAWAGFCEWIDFPLVLFIASCALAIAVFLYVAVRPIPDS